MIPPIFDVVNPRDNLIRVLWNFNGKMFNSGDLRLEYYLVSKVD